MAKVTWLPFGSPEAKAHLAAGGDEVLTYEPRTRHVPARMPADDLPDSAGLRAPQQQPPERA